MKKEVQNSLIMLFALVLMSVLLLFTNPIIIGNVVYQYEEDSYTWDFTNPNNYHYDDSKISLTQNQANLIQVTEDNSWNEYITHFSLVTQALKNNNQDKTNKVISIGSGHVDINKNDILDVTFDYELNNGDMIYLYLKGNKISNIYLCDENTQCTFPNYGFLEYPGEEGWYSIIIENLQEPKNTFGFDVDYEKIKFDYMNTSYTTTILHNITNHNYYNSSIETNDLEPEDWSEWGIFTVDDNLNNQNIIYQYSIDSGNTWIEVNDNLSNVNSNKIRFKINLESNNIGTPYVYSLSLNYFTSYCTENWNCNEYNECNENNLQTRTCVDLNECGITMNKPDETQSCVYYGTYYEINDNEIISIKKDTLTTLNSSNIILDILVNEDANLTNFTLRNYNNHSNPLSNKIDLDKYIDIESSLNLNNAILKIYYTNEEINSLNEDNIKLYYYNETSNEWQELESFVNKQENYVWTNLSHLSTYGVFGDEVSTSSPSSGSSGGSSGGGSSSSKKVEDTIIKEESEEIKEEIQEEPKEIIPQLIEEKEEKNIFRIFTGQVTDKFRDLNKYVLDLLIFLLIILGFLIYGSIRFFKRK